MGFLFLAEILFDILDLLVNLKNLLNKNNCLSFSKVIFLYLLPNLLPIRELFNWFVQKEH
ncbi:hypothetical protein A9B99_19650 [Mangrovibacter phragmitis]|uniref:Uncharacterized protein n=1 Tax=Mangrovibacter phragmitis TaxID=1691903 RepID=A0A1B7L6Q6_9ENTR|nr:hypothetical protein A9B99_19650 [Mangrovibacter phragmitis]